MSDRNLVAAGCGTVGAQTPATVAVILVPLDGSELAERALPVASRLARKLQAEIHLLSAVSHEVDARRREADLDAVHVTVGKVHRSVVVDVDPVGAIHTHVEGLTGAVVCMASHGRGRSAGIVGSVANEVIARSDNPLIIVGPHIDDVAPSSQEGLSGSGVVACVDETPASASVLPVALRWARLLQEPTIVVTVAEPVPSPFAEAPARRRFGPEGDVEAFLGSLVAADGASDADVTTHAIWDPISPAEGVHSYLREHPASLVVVGSRARHGLARVLFGSVAAGIVHASPSPVLVVPRPDRG